MVRTNKSSGLGKGFGSLLPGDFDESILLDKKDRIQKLLISNINPDPSQPRKHFDQKSLEGLSESVKHYGVLQPIVVCPEGGSYVIIAGERRYRAAKLAGLKYVPALVRTSQELERLEIGLVENVQREDLSPLEQAVSIARLHEQFNTSYEDIAKRLGKAHTTIVNIVRLLQLSDPSKEALINRQISEGHGRALLALKENAVEEQKLLEHIIKDGWSVRRAEQHVQQVKAGQKQAATARPAQDYKQHIAGLAKKFDTSVKIKEVDGRGKVEIHFDSHEQKELILKKLLD